MWNLLIYVVIIDLVIRFFVDMWIKFKYLDRKNIDKLTKISDFYKSLFQYKKIVFLCLLFFVIGWASGFVTTLPGESNHEVSIGFDTDGLREWSAEFSDQMKDYNLTMCRVVESGS